MTDRPIFNEFKAPANKQADEVLEGKSLMDKNCIRCHKMKNVNDYTLTRWNVILPKWLKNQKLQKSKPKKFEPLLFGN